MVYINIAFMSKLVNKNIITFKDVSFVYDNKNKILNNVSFNIKENDFVCVVGDNGSGKSTLVKLIGGLLKPTDGKIFFKDKPINYHNYQLLLSNIGVVLDDPYQIIGQTPEEDIAFWLQNKYISTKKIKNIISSIINIMHLEKIINQNFSKLSSGEKQLVILASVLAMNYGVLIFDEANLFLDNKSKIDFSKLVNLLWKKYKKTIIWITHDLNDIQDVTKILYIDHHCVSCFNNKITFVKKFCFSKKKFDPPFTLKLSSKIKYIKPTVIFNDLVKRVSNVK